MTCSWYNQQFLIVIRQVFVSILTEITRVGFLAMNQQYGTVYLTDVRQQWHIDERQWHGRYPCSVGVDGARMEATVGLVVIKVILYKLWLIPPP